MKTHSELAAPVNSALMIAAIDADEGRNRVLGTGRACRFAGATVLEYLCLVLSLN